MKKEFKQTLKMFMKDYTGFDWEHGKLVLVVDGCPHICTGSWRILVEKYSNRVVKRWTHDKDTMVITL